MAYSGTFEIDVVGDPRKESSIPTFEAMIHNRVLQIDQAARITERNFQRITYNITWSGLPKNMVALSAAWSTLQRVISTHLSNWTYSVKLILVEKEGD